MENASKALIMAGSVLIAMIVISILVMFFGNLQSLQKTELTAEEVEKKAEFNKQYDSYARDVYGSDILSLANKIDDYNKRIAENDDYTKIELYVKIENDIDSTYFKQGTYTSRQLRVKVEQLEDKIEQLGNVAIRSNQNRTITRKVSKLATMRTNDIEALGFELSQYQQKVSEYNSYKSLLTQVKAKVFKYVDFEYDENTGRITKMNYKV